MLSRRLSYRNVQKCSIKNRVSCFKFYSLLKFFYLQPVACQQPPKSNIKKNFTFYIRQGFPPPCESFQLDVASLLINIIVLVFFVEFDIQLSVIKFFSMSILHWGCQMSTPQRSYSLTRLQSVCHSLHMCVKENSLCGIILFLKKCMLDIFWFKIYYPYIYCSPVYCSILIVIILFLLLMDFFVPLCFTFYQTQI